MDASYSVHPDCKSHTGAMMSLGNGAISSMSRKQKLNTKSSTEAELEGVDDASAQILWTNYFIQSQGYVIDETELFQDNLSATLLEINGRESSGRRTKHINNLVFFY